MLTSMVRFHPLQGVAKETSAPKIYFSRFSDNTAVNLTSRPKRMSHGTPRVLWVSAKVALAIFPHMKPGSCS